MNRKNIPSLTQGAIQVKNITNCHVKFVCVNPSSRVPQIRQTIINNGLYSDTPTLQVLVSLRNNIGC